MFENHPKCRIRIFNFKSFSPIFVLLKLTCLVTLFDRKFQVLKTQLFFCIFNTFVHLKCKISSLRSQYWIWISFSGDEILALNGKSLQGMSHDEAINEFRAIKQGPVILKVAKRDPNSDQDPIVIVKE